MAKRHSATSRACSSRPAGPLAETQLVDVRRAVDRVRGLGVRSIKVHGVIVFLEIKEQGVLVWQAAYTTVEGADCKLSKAYALSSEEDAADVRHSL